MNRRSKPKPINVEAKLAELRTKPDVRYRRRGETRWRKANLVDVTADVVTIRTDNGGIRDLSRMIYETEQPLSSSKWEALI